jgi:FliI/YscN family ATPase
MIARRSDADINVVALIGERGREVREFLENDLSEEGRARSIVIVATADQPALLRVKAASLALQISEQLRDEGRKVLLMMDSVTRFAMAQREIGLAVGEPPTARGYTPSVFAALPRLLERAGNSDRGSITGIFTVLVEGDDLTEPIADATRSILDGHIVLSRRLAERGQYPAIDIEASISRVMHMVTTPEHLALAKQFRHYYSLYEQNQDLFNVGAYQAGTNPELDRAVSMRNLLTAYMRQDPKQAINSQTSIDMLAQIFPNG